jgi:hypothetical protein
MELMNFIFRLGVLFAIYGFIWGIFEIGLSILRAGNQRTIFEDYFLKAVKYIFLVDVTFLFCLDLENGQISDYHVTMTALVLLTYFIGKFQNKQNQAAMFQMMGGSVPGLNTHFNIKAEIGVITLSIGMFLAFIFFPDFAKNPISIWFHDSIMNIEDTPIIGFIFKVIGFFFLISMIFKMFNGFIYLLSGRPFVQASSSFTSFREKKKEDDFDDYEEIK